MVLYVILKKENNTGIKGLGQKMRMKADMRNGETEF